MKNLSKGLLLASMIVAIAGNVGGATDFSDDLHNNMCLFKKRSSLEQVSILMNIVEKLPDDVIPDDVINKSFEPFKDELRIMYSWQTNPSLITSDPNVDALSFFQNLENYSKLVFLNDHLEELINEYYDKIPPTYFKKLLDAAYSAYMTPKITEKDFGDDITEMFD